jgi:hypothetical protein
MDAERYRWLEQNIWSELSEDEKLSRPWYAGRDNSSLTTRQREYLIGLDDDMSTNQKTSTRAQIRERTRDAIRDFRILHRQLDVGEKVEIIKEHSEAAEESEDQLEPKITDEIRREAQKIAKGRQERVNKEYDAATASCLTDMIGFVYHCEFTIGDMEKVVERGIKQTLNQHEVFADVEVSIKRNLEESHENAVERLEQHGVVGDHPDTVSKDRLIDLYKVGAISQEEGDKYLRRLEKATEQEVNSDDGSVD